MNKRGGVKSCLIVDDSRIVRRVARRILEELHFTCAEAEDGQQALESCQKSMPDAVLLDWNMPVMGGHAFLENLRGMKGGKVPCVVLCTVEKGDDVIKKAMENGASEYIKKPFDKKVVEEKFRGIGLID